VPAKQLQLNPGPLDLQAVFPARSFSRPVSIAVCPGAFPEDFFQGFLSGDVVRMKSIPNEFA
jgi:hypothetical protein